MNLFVIIVTYNGMQWYDRCFESLRHSKTTVTTVVIDNNSSDNSADYIQTNYPEIKYIQSEKNLGFGQANNKGIEYALNHNADYVFLLNQDAWIESDTFERILGIQEKYPEYGILSPMHMNADFSAIENGLLGHITRKGNAGAQLLSDLYTNNVGEVYDSYVNAAGWLLPKNTLLTVGGFDPIFFHYGEDDNYLQRVLFHGLKVGICPSCRMVHDRVVSNQVSNTEQKRYWLVEWTDINKSFRPNKILIKTLFKLIVNSLKFKKEKVVYFYNMLVYLRKNRVEILKSRVQNKKIGLSWITINH